MKKFAVAAFICAMLAASLPLHAQERQLTLDEAIEIALRNNRDIQVARLETEKADAQVKEAFGNALPSIDLGATYTRNLQKQVFYFPGADGISRPISIGSDNALVTDLSLRQILFNSAVLTGVGTAETYAKISRQQLRASAAQTVLSVKKAYYGALFARDVLALNEQLLRNAESNYQSARQFFQAGVRAEFDAIRAEVQVENQRPAVVQARDNYEMTIDNLRLLMGIPSGDSIILTGTLERPATTESTEVPAVAAARALLEQHNAQLQTLRLSTEVSEKLIDISRSEYLPTVALFGTYQYQAQADKFSDLDFQPSSMVGLNFSLNLFNGWQTSARVEQARIDHLKSEQQLAQLDQALHTQLESVMRRINYSQQRITASERTIAQAERGYQIATVAYRAGTGTQLQINDAELALAQSRLNQLNAIFDYRNALADLEGLLGDNVALNSNENDVVYTR